MRGRAVLILAAAAALGAAGWLAFHRSGDSSVRSATQAQNRVFGADPILVRLQGNLQVTLAPANLQALHDLEGRISGLPGVKAVAGPARFISQTAVQIRRLIAEQLAQPGFTSGANAPSRLSDLLVRYGYTGLPSLSNESFVGQLVFGSAAEPKPRLAWLFPDGNDALVSVRPRSGLSAAQTRALAAQILTLARSAPLDGVAPSVSEPPVVRVAITAHDVTAPAVRSWLSSVQTHVLALDPRLRSGPDLAGMLSAGDYVDAAVSPDHRRGELSFGLAPGSPSDLSGLIARIRDTVGNATAGVTAKPVGTLALAAASGGTGWLWLLPVIAVAVLVLSRVESRRATRLPGRRSAALEGVPT
jgi:hypothetical protein